ncbi:MAG: hypothetical protein DRR11_13650, partial [Gammaproteobacteria bacterium]
SKWPKLTVISWHIHRMHTDPAPARIAGKNMAGFPARTCQSAPICKLIHSPAIPNCADFENVTEYNAS